MKEPEINQPVENKCKCHTKFIFKGTDTGNYKIKVLNPEIFKLNFDIINLNIERYPYPLIQILGKR